MVNERAIKHLQAHWMDGSDPGLVRGVGRVSRDAGADRLRQARRHGGRDSAGRAQGRRRRAPQRARRHRGRDHRGGRGRRPHGRRLERPPHRVPEQLRAPARRSGAGLRRRPRRGRHHRGVDRSRRSGAAARRPGARRWAGCAHACGPAGPCFPSSATGQTAGSRPDRARSAPPSMASPSEPVGVEAPGA